MSEGVPAGMRDAFRHFARGVYWGSGHPADEEKFHLLIILTHREGWPIWEEAAASLLLECPDGDGDLPSPEEAQALSWKYRDGRELLKLYDEGTEG